jgi:hypothetical protein
MAGHVTDENRSGAFLLVANRDAQRAIPRRERLESKRAVFQADKEDLTRRLLNVVVSGSTRAADLAARKAVPFVNRIGGKPPGNTAPN